LLSIQVVDIPLLCIQAVLVQCCPKRHHLLNV
jgi:hypothetical protein